MWPLYNGLSLCVHCRESYKTKRHAMLHFLYRHCPHTGSKFVPTQLSFWPASPIGVRSASISFLQILWQRYSILEWDKVKLSCSKISRYISDSWDIFNSDLKSMVPLKRTVHSIFLFFFFFNLKKNVYLTTVEKCLQMISVKMYKFYSRCVLFACKQCNLVDVSWGLSVIHFYITDTFSPITV